MCTFDGNLQEGEARIHDHESSPELFLTVMNALAKFLKKEEKKASSYYLSGSQPFFFLGDLNHAPQNMTCNSTSSAVGVIII